MIADLHSIRAALGPWATVTPRRRHARAVAVKGLHGPPAPRKERLLAMVDQMTAGDSLHVNDELNAANSPVKVVFQEDGNLVLYRTDFQPWKALWTTPTWHKPAREADMQPDGNFVIYNTDVTPHQALWATNTWNHPGSRLVLQDDGNLVIYDPNDHPLWATNTWQPDLPAHWATAPDAPCLPRLVTQPCM